MDISSEKLGAMAILKKVFDFDVVSVKHNFLLDEARKAGVSPIFLRLARKEMGCRVYKKDGEWWMCKEDYRPPISQKVWGLLKEHSDLTTKRLVINNRLSEIERCIKGYESGLPIDAIERLLFGRFSKDDYALYLDTKHWKDTRGRAIDHYGPYCRLCGELATQVHHLAALEAYKHLFAETVFMLTPVCDDCHDKAHS